MNRGFLATSRSCYTFQSPNRCWLDFKSGSRIMNLLIDQPSYMYQIIAMTQINVSFQKSEFKTTTIIKILITSSNVTVKALYIFAQKRIHTKRPVSQSNYKNATITGPVWTTVKEHPAYGLLSLHSSARVSVWQRWMGSEMRGGLGCVVHGQGSLSWLDIVRWGQPRGQSAGSPGMQASYQL